MSEAVSTPAKLRWALVAAALISCVGFNVFQIASAFVHPESDFTVFWAGGRMFLEDPARLYDFQSVTALQAPYTQDPNLRPWVYPPTYLPLILPFAALPVWWAYAIWLVVTTLPLVALTYAVTRDWRVPALSLGSAAVLFCLTSGQNALLIGAAVLGAVILLRDRPGVAGVLLAAAALVKPQVMILAPVALIAGGHGRAMKAALVSGAAVLSIAVALAPTLWLDWIGALNRFLPVVDQIGIGYRAPTGRGLAETLGVGGWTEMVVVGGAAALGLSLVVITWRRSEDAVIRSMALSAGCLLASPYAMGYDLALAAVMGMVLMLDKERAPALWGAGAIFAMARGPVLLVLGSSVLLWAIWRARERLDNPPVANQLTARSCDGRSDRI